MKKFIFLIGKLQQLMLTLAGILLAISTLLAIINTILRYVVGSGLAWSEEVTTYLVVFVVFFGIAYLEYTEDQLSIDITNSLLKESKLKTIIAIIRKLVTISALLILLYYNVISAQKALLRQTTTAVLNLPRYLMYSITAGCLIVTILGLIISLITLKQKGEVE